MSSDKVGEYEELEVCEHADPLLKHRSTDDFGIRIGAGVTITLIVALALLFPNAARDVIDAARTWVTQYFSWYFIILAGTALVFCIVLGASRFGTIRLGGPRAKPKYSRFAWYSMLFACGQGIGLIFWSVAEPIMVQHDNPLLVNADAARDSAMSWTYYHWAITAWAIYCTVAVCIAYSMHNRREKPTFRGSCEDLFQGKMRRVIGVIVEYVAIITTVLGVATSFGFASLQFASGLSFSTGVETNTAMKIVIIAVIGVIAAVSVFFGIEKGMKRLSELNSILSIVLIAVVFTFGPTLYLLHLLPETIGVYIDQFVGMTFYTDPLLVTSSLGDWRNSWNGWWTVFIWCWCFAFSPFVASFIASISRGRTIREFIFGVIVIPSAIVVVWVGVIGGTALQYDAETSGAITEAVQNQTSDGMFAVAQHIPVVGSAVVILATVLVATYFITSLDSGVHALSSFVSMGARPSAWFRVALVLMIVGISLIMLIVGGDNALDTIQTGTIIGALPFTAVVILMVINLVRRVLEDTRQYDDLTDDTAEKPLAAR